MSIDDYGPHADDGTRFAHLPEHWIEAGLKRGREADFMAFLLAQTDDASRRLLDCAQSNRRDFNRALGEWVREWNDAGRTLPDYVEQQRRSA